MRHSESRLDEDSPVTTFLRDMVSAAGAAAARNPVVVGGATAFVVTLSFIVGNALWNQQQPHQSAFFITREISHFAAPRGEDASAADPRNVAPHRVSDPIVQRAQGMLKGLGLYSGAVDGLTGPQTRKAVEEYQSLMGFEPTGQIDQRLLDEMATQHGAAEPVANVDPVSVATNAPARNQPPLVEVEKIQAGLKAFGHDTMEIDGIVGSKTRAAIREFQGLFGMPVTGEPDVAVIAKMREIGLTN